MPRIQARSESREMAREHERDARRQQEALSKERLDAWLDGALADTFPASDPVASPPADAALVERGDRQAPKSAESTPHQRRTRR